MNIRNRRPLCNNNPASAPRFNGKCFLLCWRCTGALVGGFIVTAISFAMDCICSVTPLVFLLILPACIDYFCIRRKIIPPSNTRRFVTGVMLGIPISMAMLTILC